MEPIGKKKAKALQIVIERLFDDIVKLGEKDLASLHPDEIAEFVVDFNMELEGIGQALGFESNQVLVFGYAEFLLT